MCFVSCHVEAILFASFPGNRWDDCTVGQFVLPTWHIYGIFHAGSQRTVSRLKWQPSPPTRRAKHTHTESWAWSYFFLQGKQMFSFFLCFLLLQLHRWINLKCCLLWGCSRCLQRRRFGQFNNLSPNIAVPGCRVYMMNASWRFIWSRITELQSHCCFSLPAGEIAGGGQSS